MAAEPAILDGKVALVTGSSRGIGRAIAERLASAGALVAVHYGRSREAADAVVAGISGRGGKAFAVGADLTSVPEIVRMFEALDAALRERTGSTGIDILVNCAGLGGAGRVDTTSEETFDAVFAVNIKGPFFVTQHAIPRLRDGGRVINISSMVATRAFPEVAAYAASKAALNGLTRSLAVQLGSRGITVNAVSPGMTRTDLVKTRLANEAYVNATVAATALGRIGEPEDVAGAVLQLASPAAAWITGQVVEASGGQQL